MYYFVHNVNHIHNFPILISSLLRVHILNLNFKTKKNNDYPANKSVVYIYT